MNVHGESFRDGVRSTLLRHAEQASSVLITGAAGSGKTFVLRALAQELRAGPLLVHEITADAPDAAQRIKTAEHSSLLLVDDLDRADTPTFHALLRALSQGQQVVITLTTGRPHTRTARQVSALVPVTPGLGDAWKALQVVALAPLSFFETAHLIHDHSPTLIDADLCHTMCVLSAGNPGWAIDLLTLARLNVLSSRPRPSIVDIPRDTLSLPALRSLARAIGRIRPEHAAAAGALAMLGPFDLAGARDFAGANTTSELIEHGMLAQAASPDLFVVPPFAAAAVSSCANEELHDQWRSKLADYWLEQEELGIPLSSAETLSCARSLTVPARTESPDRRSTVRIRVLHRAAAGLLTSSGAPQARTLLLRLGVLNVPIAELERVRALRAFAGPAPAWVELTTMPLPQSSSEQLLHELLRAQFAAEACLQSGSAPFDTATPSNSGEPPSPAAGPRDADAAEVFRLWNTTESIVSSRLRLRRISASHVTPEVAELAAALADLDLVWDGRLPSGSWLATGAPLPRLRDQSTEFSRSAAGVLLLTHALITFLAGEHAIRAEELSSVAQELVPAEAHERWLRHFCAASTALACGNTERAGLEWRLLEQEAPRFIPVRLRETLGRIGVAITTVADPPLAGVRPKTVEELPTRILQYLSGNHTSLTSSPATNNPPADVLPMTRLANSHLRAAAEQNPSELLRAANRLLRLQLWAPAAYALTSARVIFLGRRAVRGVQDCDERLRNLHEQLTAQVPWYRPGSLPTAAVVRLTPREHEVAALAAEGQSNAQISAQVGCSVRTVESHLAQARAKLGSVSRQDLAVRLIATNRPLDSTAAEAHGARQGR